MLPSFFSRTVPVLFLILLIFCSPTLAAKNNEPTIEDIIITTSNTDLLLFATVKNCFTDEMLTGVRNGIPLTFSFQLQLDQIRSNWFDVTLVEKTITHTMTYNAIKEEYSIVFSEKNNLELTRSEDKARQLMAELSGLEVINRGTLIPDASYSIRIKATMDENTLPLGMHYIIPFTSLWNFETDWRTIEFRY